MSLQNVAIEYFSNLNPIASRMYADMQETKGAYEELWNKLSQAEQNQILTESIIKPEVSIKYGSPETKINEEYALKIVVDDHCSYQDEHSGPFSFRTQSQRNLTIFQEEQSKAKLIKDPVEPKSKPIPKPTNVPLYAQSLNLEDISCTVRSDDELSSNSGTLPKTGLDFLDNW